MWELGSIASYFPLDGRAHDYRGAGGGVSTRPEAPPQPNVPGPDRPTSCLRPRLRPDFTGVNQGGSVHESHGAVGFEKSDGSSQRPSCQRIVRRQQHYIVSSSVLHALVVRCDMTSIALM